MPLTREQVLADFQPQPGDRLAWAESIAQARWEPIAAEIESLRQHQGTIVNPFSLDAHPGKSRVPASLHEFAEHVWHRLDTANNVWLPIKAKQLPMVLVPDAESSKFEERSDNHFIPILLCAFGGDGCWYIWRNTKHNVRTAPFPPNRIVINHNVMYDARYFSCEYKHHGATTYLDTMSMATAIYGVSSQQRALHKALEKNKAEGKGIPAWAHYSCAVSLKSLVKQVFGHDMPKTVRDELVEHPYHVMMAGVCGENDGVPTTLYEYCCDDVKWTLKLFFHLYDKLSNPDDPVFPSPVTWIGMIELGRVRVFLRDFDGFRERSEDEWQVQKERLRTMVLAISHGALKDFEVERNRWLAENVEGSVEQIELRLAKLKTLAADVGVRIAEAMAEQISMRTIKKAQGKAVEPSVTAQLSKLAAELVALRAKKKKIQDRRKEVTESLKTTKDALAGLSDHIEVWGSTYKVQGLDWRLCSSGNYKGYPIWYRDLSKPTEASPLGFSPSSRIFINLLRLRWGNEPIFWEKIDRSGTWRTEAAYLPHPVKGQGEPISKVLNKDYADHVRTTMLSSKTLSLEDFQEFYDTLQSLAQWTSYRKRYASVYALNTEHDGVVCKTDVVPAGTLTRRATSGLWVVAPKPNRSKIGSEIMFHICAKPGYLVGGADLDSQESKLLALLADCYIGKLAGNGWTHSVLYGDKDKATDIHSLVAGQVLPGVEDGRQHAKGLNFGCVPVETSKAFIEDRGWVNVGQVQLGDRILAYDPTTETYQFTEVQQLNRYEQREVFTLKDSKGWEIESTLGHRWVCSDGTFITTSDIISGTAYRKSIVHEVTNNTYQKVTIPVSELRLGTYRFAQAVWCPTTAFGTWVVQQGDTTTITGNSAYGAGIEKLATMLANKLGLPWEEAYAKASAFINYLKGDRGIAVECFTVLRRLSRTNDVRTSILRVKVPNAINARYTRSYSYSGGQTREKYEFVTTAQNWQIQSAGVDQLHLLLVILRHLFDHYGVDATLMVPIHDAVYYSVDPEHEEAFRACMDAGHRIMQEISYEQASLYVADVLDLSHRNIIEPPANGLYYHKIKLGDSLGMLENPKYFDAIEKDKADEVGLGIDIENREEAMV
jgi:citrate lyase gamma subunit